ncbi:MAG: hypothetical protein HOW97_24375 [Catenulispora sp.]|nr:hypothetical protein [Catenulispora sp.]
MKTLTGDALVTALDDQAWQAARKEDELAADPIKRRYMPLLTAAVAFWRELTAAVEDGEPLTREQQYAADVVASGALRGGPRR